jgi:hypothetical protein
MYLVWQNMDGLHHHMTICKESLEPQIKFKGRCMEHCVWRSIAYVMEWSFVRCSKDPHEVPECVEERTLRGGIRPPLPWRYAIALKANPNCRNRAKDAGNWLCLEPLWGRGSCGVGIASACKRGKPFPFCSTLGSAVFFTEILVLLLFPKVCFNSL